MPENTLSDTTQNTSFTVTLDEDGDDLIMPIPEQILQKLDWNEGDELEWIPQDNNTFIIKKAHGTI